MMRVKVPGGVLTADQAREIGVVADAFGEGPDDSPVFGNRYADITTRQTIQIHWIRIADVPRIWERFADVGLTTVQACGDSARNVSSCPVSGVDAEEVFDALPIARAISEFFTGNREYANLPRKFKMSVTGLPRGLRPGGDQRHRACGRRAPRDGTLGFNVLVGGGSPTASAWPRTSTSSCVSIRPSRSPGPSRSSSVSSATARAGAWPGCGISSRSSGPSSSVPSSRPGPASSSSRPARSSPRRYRGDHIGVHPQHDTGLRYVGCSVPVGRMSGIELVEAARLARTYGDGTMRLGTDQNFVLTGVPEDKVDALLDEELLQKYSPFPGPFERGVVACTGSEFCRFAVVETKERAVTVGALARHPAARTTRSGNVRTRAGPRRREDAGVIRMHFSGCSASCAQPQIADIGFRGDIAHVGEHIVEAVDIGMGGSLGPDAGFIDWIENARPVDDVPDALLRTVRRYQSERRDGEPFYNWARRVPNEELAATLAGLDTDHAPVVNR